MRARPLSAIKHTRTHAQSRVVVSTCAHAVLRKSEAFKGFVKQTAELRAVCLSGLDDEERTAFWLNVYNLLVMHGYVEWAHQLSTKQDLLTVLRLHHRFEYDIGGLSYSVWCVWRRGALLGHPTWYGVCGGGGLS